MSSTHQAAAITTMGQPLTIIERKTQDPGPNEVLIQVKALAVNPVDYYQRDRGIPPIISLPCIAGTDVSGIITKSNDHNSFKPGSRVLAFASSYYHQGDPTYGAFQEYVVARCECVIELPENLSFEEGAIMPLAVLTALSGYTTIGLSLDTHFTPTDAQAILIWGASSSVGSFAVQSAARMGFTVYATAGANNLDYVEKLGAHAVFDYKDANVVRSIAQQAHDDNVHLNTAHVIVNDSLQQTLDVLALTKGDALARVAHAPLIPENAPSLENVEIKFTHPPAEEDARNRHIRQCYHGWLKDGLESGQVIPSPRIHTIAGGLIKVNEALDALRAGVSATKVVVTL